MKRKCGWRMAWGFIWCPFETADLGYCGTVASKIVVGEIDTSSH
ncbi:MAG TPA: hypothetical protein PK411_11240 [Mesotoga infera]|nr:hypothetical protein [Mesotoga infera]HPD38905.1 hypothetical protein [Mesotoga infera]HRV02428.1 hypothetical protein [Mesotoga sp.]